MHFPLPLAPFELLMYRDDFRRDYPMWFEIACDFSGSIERAPFEEAVRLARSRHPLTTAQVAEIGGYPQWSPANAPQNAVYWALDNREDVVERFYERVTLEAACGIRVLVIADGSLIRIIWRIHHSCCDGIGGCRVIGDALAIYHGLVTGTDWSTCLKDLDADLLAVRADYSRGRKPPPVAAEPTRKTWHERWQAIQQPFREAAHFLTRAPEPIATGTPQTDSAFQYSLLTKKLSREESDRVAVYANSLNASVNDIVIAGLFRTLLKWNQDHGTRASRNFLRITMPTNQRVREDQSMPAANLMSYAFLDRQPAEISDWRALVKGICFATTAIKRWNLSLQFQKTLSVFARWPALIRLCILGRGCFSSAVLSNLGDPSRRFDAMLKRIDGKIVAGNLLLESIYAAPPMRPQTRMSILVCRYDDCLTFGAMVDPKALNRDDGMELLERLTTEVLDSQGKSG